MSIDAIAPRPVETLEDTGLAYSTVEQLILKILYFRGELYGQDLSAVIGLRFSVIQKLIEEMKLAHLIVIKRSMGMGSVDSVYALTESGRTRARDYLDFNQYYGAAPVPVEQYFEIVRQQRPKQGWLTKEALLHAFRGMVLTESILSQIGPAVSSANSLLLYGKPGDGKTYLIESLANINSAPVYVPYALECQGNIIQVFDPIYHRPVEEEATSARNLYDDRAHHDRRWVKCKRPFIVTGGELSIDMLDLRFNQTSKVYEAPFQLKANNGIYLIDDFGRQRATPAEVLNRWIVPMERRVDYLSFLTGGKMTVPFEIFLVFSTNLNPKDLGDEAFLRRIQYKMLLRGPGEREFVKIFEDFCAQKKIACPRDLLQRFIEKFYRSTSKVFRRCHPRDLLLHALNLIQFEKLPWALTDDILERAFHGCFGEDNADDAAAESTILATTLVSCPEHWSEKLARVPSSFGSLMLLAETRNAETGAYRDQDSEGRFGAEETARVLEQLHRQEFALWRALGRDRQARDLGRYLKSVNVDAADLKSRLKEMVGVLMPAGSDIEDTCLFTHDFAVILDMLCPDSGEKLDEAASSEETRTPLGRIA